MKRIAIVSLALALVVALAGCIQVEVSPGASASPKVSSAPTLVPTAEPTLLPSPDVSGSPIPLDQLYTSKSGGFSVVVPADWRSTDMSTQGNEIAVFEAPSADPKDSLAAALFMDAAFPGVMPSAQYQVIFNATMNATAKDIQILEKGTQEFQGVQGYYFEFTGKDNSGETDQLLHFGYFFIFKDTHMFVMGFSAYDALFEQYSPSFENMFDSFKILV